MSDLYDPSNRDTTIADLQSQLEAAKRENERLAEQIKYDEEALGIRVNSRGQRSNYFWEVANIANAEKAQQLATLTASLAEMTAERERILHRLHVVTEEEIDTRDVRIRALEAERDALRQENVLATEKKSCNRHFDCDEADRIAKEKQRERGLFERGADHCHDDCCEDCFGQ